MTQVSHIQQDLQDFGVGKVDNSWGPKSQQALLAALRSGYKLTFDFQAFRVFFKRSSIEQSFVDNINVLFSLFNSYLDNPDPALAQTTNPLHIAYMLATTWHETAHTMKPIKEYGSNAYLAKYDTGKLARILGNTPEADGDGQRYAGRGYVQITGRTNYKKFSDLLGIDLIANPDLTLQADTAGKILIIGSMKGLFTGHSLPRHIKTGTTAEFAEARRVINGRDKADVIAEHAKKFTHCIKLATPE